MGHVAHKIGNPDWLLYTRGGTQDVFVENVATGERVNLPTHLLRSLVAEEVREYKLGVLERESDNEVLGL